MRLFFNTYFLLILIIPVLFSCQNDEISELEARIDALEMERNNGIILTDVTARSQASIDYLGEQKVKSIKGTFTISGDNITDLSSLDSLKDVGALLIVRNPLLKTLDGLNNLAFVKYDVSIFDNDSLQNLNGLEGLNSIIGYLDIKSNPLLDNYCAIKTQWEEGNFYISIYNNKFDPNSWEDISDCN